MRILHAPTNIAGQPYVVSRALRRLGHHSDVVVTRHHEFGYPDDLIFDFDHLASPWRQIRKGVALLKLIGRYDVFHFYFGETLLSNFGDLPILRRAGRRVVFHFRGCEIRMRERELAQRRYSACTDCPAPCALDARKLELRELAWRLADDVLVATPDLLEWVPGARLVVQAIDVDTCRPVAFPNPRRESFVIVHAPSSPLIKGTSYLKQAVVRLQARGYPIELRLLEGRSHAEVCRAIEEADVVVDQLLLGWYGNFAIEAMARSRPVISYIREDLNGIAGFSPPVLSARPDTIETELGRLIDDSSLRADLAQAGRRYVEQKHEAALIARQLLEVYSAPRVSRARVAV